MTPRPPIVLVHGSWHGAWCWEAVVPLLEAAGHAVYAPTLTGLAERAGELSAAIDLGTHVRDVVRVFLDGDLRDAVLVGHSYAGMVITAAAGHLGERLRRLVYVDAYVPGPGECLLDLWPEEDRVAALAELRTGSGLRPVPAAADLGIADPDLARRAEARLTPHPLRTYTGVTPALPLLARSVQRAYLHCTLGPSAGFFATFAGRVRAGGGIVREIASGHDVMLVRPRECAAALLDFAGTGVPAASRA